MTSLSLLESLKEDSWRKIEKILVSVLAVVIAVRIPLPHLLSVGAVLALFLLPIWLPYARRHDGAAALLGLGLGAVVSGMVLTVLAATDHDVGLGTMLDNSTLLVGLLAGLGGLLWTRRLLGDGVTAALFGVGLTLGVSPDSSLYADSPWKFGYASGVTLFVLALIHLTGRRGLELVAVLFFAGLAALTDSRSAFGQLLLVSALLIWQLRPLARSRGGSAFRGAVGLLVGSAFVFFLGQAAILNGYLGAATQSRSIQQIDTSGSLLLGGRPEIAATLALMRNRPWGYGSGTHINHADLMVAKNGMAALHYDPNNGYVERYMFGTTYELHSVFSDLWSRFGLVGVVVALLMTFLVVRRVAREVSGGTGSALLYFLAAMFFWDMFFSPWYSALEVLPLTLALVLTEREPSSSDGVAEPHDHE